jgi:hypothetical protein
MAKWQNDLDDALESVQEVVNNIEIEGDEGGWRLDVQAAIWPFAVLTFLVLIFVVEDSGRYAWLVFIAAWVLDGIATAIRTRRVSFSLYGLATIVFLALGFVWGYWHPGWLVFVAAWALESLFRRRRPRVIRWKKSDNS